MRTHLRICLPLFALGMPMTASADGPLRIDHRVTYDDSGIWRRDYQEALAWGGVLTVIGGVAFADRDSRLGRTFAQSLDAMVLTAGTTTAMKYAFSRARPRQGNDPDNFFAGRGYDSFPSGEVAEISAIVTPFIAEYGTDHPAVYALALLPVYDAVARVKVQGHWQSDVVVGAAIGVAWGLYAHHRESPLIVGMLPGGGVTLGYYKEF